MKILRDCLCLAILLCLLQGVQQVLATSDAKEIARQAAAEANDNAVSLEDRREALKKLEYAVRLYLSAGDTVEAARALNRIGRLQLILNDPKQVLASHNTALSLLKQTPAVEVEVDNLNGLAAGHWFLQDNGRAEEVLRKALILSEQSGYTLGRAEALLTLSELQNQNNHETALQTASEALTLWQSLGDKRGLARTFAHLGRCYMAQNTLPEAIQNYQKALQVWRELSDVSQQAGVLIMLGFIEYRNAEWESSISLLIQAQDLLDPQAEPKKMGQVAAGLAEAFNQNGLPENGIIQYQQALNYYRHAQDPRGVRYAIWGLGLTYYLLGKYPEALSHLQQTLADVAKDSLDAAASYEYIGRVYIATDEPSTAQPYLQSALAIYERAVNPREAAQVRGLMGQIHQQQGHLERARKDYLQALDTFRKISDRANQAAVYYALGRLEMKGRNYGAAEDYLRQSIEVTENMRQTSVSRDLTTAFSASVHERYESYIACLMLRHRSEPAQGLAVRAFEFSELSRARSLADLLRATGTNLTRGMDPQLAAQEKTLRQALRLKENSRISLLRGLYKKEELDALEKELKGLEAEYKKVTETIRQLHPSYNQITHPVAWGLQQIQEQILSDDETVLLEYSLGAERGYVWAVTHHNITTYEVPSHTVITAAVQKVYELLATAPGVETEDKLNSAAHELSQMVLSPVAAELNKRRVIVVADGALNYIPFQILPVPSGNREQLIAGHEVINAPSASILGQLRQERTRRQPAAVVLAAFGDPVFASDYAQRKDANAGDLMAVVQPETERWQHALRDVEFTGDALNPAAIQPLFYATRELANLRDVAGPETLMVTGFDATREKLANADLTKYAILHFATHGVLNPKRPENSGLFLSMVNRDGQEQNGFVRLQDIYGLQTPVDLVVLSACRTGLGKDVRGEGLIGLTRGFMYAGASSVVASLWKVDDEATSELMKQFYTNMLQRGMTPAAALRAAQNSIRQEPQWRSPFFWAAFTLQGEYNQVIRPTPPRFSSYYLKAVAAGFLFVLMTFVVWRYWRRRGRGYSTVNR